MNYYKRHIGDYAAKAGHLSMLEHGAYGLLMDAYYNREQGPTRAEAIRLARARTTEEIAAVDAVLAEFFTETDGQFTQNRIEEELAAFRVKQEVNRHLGAKGGKANAKRIATETLSEMEAKQVPHREANDKPSHKPLASNQEEAKEIVASQADACPQAAIVALYHELLPTCQRVKVWKGARESHLRSRWREDPKRQSLDYWRRLFTHVGKSDFLMGRVSSHARAPFVFTLAWLVNAENFAKVIEGNYNNVR